MTPNPAPDSVKTHEVLRGQKMFRARIPYDAISTGSEACGIPWESVFCEFSHSLAQC